MFGKMRKFLTQTMIMAALLSPSCRPTARCPAELVYSGHTLFASTWGDLAVT